LEENLNRARPTCQWPISFLPPRPSNRARSAHYGTGDQMVTVLAALSVAKPATASRRPPPRVGTARGCHQRKPRCISPLLATTLPCFHLCSALARPPLLVFTSHHRATSFAIQAKGLVRHTLLYMQHPLRAQAAGHHPQTKPYTGCHLPS
jgi:hypothetical protein